MQQSFTLLQSINHGKQFQCKKCIGKLKHHQCNEESVKVNMNCITVAEVINITAAEHLHDIAYDTCTLLRLKQDHIQITDVEKRRHYPLKVLC